MELQWELMLFTLFISLAAGIFGTLGLLALCNKGKGVHMPALIASLCALVVGGIASFLHLNHWERIFNGFGNLTSGITQELIGIVIFAIALVVYFVMLRRSEDQVVPKWCGIMALVVSLALVIVMSLSYYMASRPIWDTPLLMLFFVASGAFTGCLGVGLIASVRQNAKASLPTGEDATEDDVKQSSLSSIKLLKRASLIAGIALVIVTAVYVAFFAIATSSVATVGYYFDATLPTKPMIDPGTLFSSILVGEYALVFWLGVVLVGLIVPLACIVIANKMKPPTLPVFFGAALMCALIGSMCFRVILYVLAFSVFLFY